MSLFKFGRTVSSDVPYDRGEVHTPVSFSFWSGKEGAFVGAEDWSGIAKLGADTTELGGLSVPRPAQLGARQLLRAVWKDLAASGVSSLSIAKELVRGIGSEALRWVANLSLLGLGLQAVSDRSPLVFAYVASWVGASALATWCDHMWRTRMNEHDRAYRRVLHSRLLNTQGHATLPQLEDDQHQGLLELHRERTTTISNLVESTVGFPSYLTRVGLSAGALLFADWRIALTLTIALVPGVWTRNRQIKEDMQLEEQQSPELKVTDAISDEAYSPAGTARMILGRFTGRVIRSLNNVQAALDNEKDAHERRQVRSSIAADATYFGVLGVSMWLLYQQYQLGAIGIGALSFLWMQLIEVGTELDEQSSSLQQYVELWRKVSSFYNFTKAQPRPAELPFPEDHSLTVRGATFVRTSGEHEFTLTLPDCSVSPGSLMLIKGASGAGKSTSLRFLSFGCQPAEGEYRVGDLPAHSIAFEQWCRAVGYCGPSSALQRGLTIREALTLDPEGETHFEARTGHPMIAELMEKLRSGKGLETRIGAGLPDGLELSTGELQRLMLVCAVVPPRKMLFLDEVTSNQSDGFVNCIMEEIERQRAHGTTVILVTHSQRFDESASHIIRVSKGKGELVREPTPAEGAVPPLRFVPRHPEDLRQEWPFNPVGPVPQSGGNTGTNGAEAIA